MNVIAWNGGGPHVAFYIYLERLGACHSPGVDVYSMLFVLRDAGTNVFVR